MPGPSITALQAVNSLPSEPPALAPVTAPAKAAPTVLIGDGTNGKGLTPIVNPDLAFTRVDLLGSRNLQQDSTRTDGFFEDPQRRNAISGSTQSVALINFSPAVNFGQLNFSALTAPEAATNARIASATSGSAFTRELDRLRENTKAEETLERNIIVSSVTAGAGMSVGYVLWLLRGGLLLTSLLSSLPAWRFVDPLPVLGRLKGDEDEDEDGESLESMVSNENAPAPDAPNETKDQRNA